MRTKQSAPTPATDTRAARIIPFPELDAGFARRYREWRAAFITTPKRPVPAGRVVGLWSLHWRRYGEWRLKQMALAAARRKTLL
jgi:hypothetical protein